MLSRPATGIARSAVISGVDETLMRGLQASVGGDLADFDHLLPAGELGGLESGELLGRVADDLEAELEQLGLDLRVVQAATIASCSLALMSAGRPLGAANACHE